MPDRSPSIEDAQETRTVLVTGGSGGIGRALCLAFAQAGWWVGVHYLNHAREAEQTLALVSKAGGEGAIYQADIRLSREIEAAMAAIRQRCGRLDVVLCNAGTAGGQLVMTCPEEEWQRIIDTNLTGTYHCMKAAANSMVTQGGGSIMVIGSYAGLQGTSGQGAYAASKAGLTGLVKTAAREWGPHNIRVNVICPGWQQTGLAGDAFLSAQRFGDHVLERASNLEAVATTICRLAQLSDVSGQVWNLDSRIL
jgi:3-oxoacyl-[acyl-carrier protein] reductase